MKKSEIHLRDPFILVHEDNYYMYGTRGSTAWGKATGFDVYKSRDLEEWEGPFEVFNAPPDFWADRHFWAPEVHLYKDKFFMFASFKSEGSCRGTQILIADSPYGPFQIHSDGPVTPSDWECLDGTLYVDDAGKPHIVFCHEWLQINDGTICAIELTGDLKAPAESPILLFHGSEPAWADKESEKFVTDGPFLFHSPKGELLMLWSSLIKENYVLAVSRSETGRLTGPWKHDSNLLFSQDGGHGMVFDTLDGQKMLALHHPNTHPLERPEFICIFTVFDVEFNKV